MNPPTTSVWGAHTVLPLIFWGGQKARSGNAHHKDIFLFFLLVTTWSPASELTEKIRVLYVGNNGTWRFIRIPTENVSRHSGGDGPPALGRGTTGPKVWGLLTIDFQISGNIQVNSHRPTQQFRLVGCSHLSLCLYSENSKKLHEVEPFYYNCWLKTTPYWFIKIINSLVNYRLISPRFMSLRNWEECLQWLPQFFFSISICSSCCARKQYTKHQFWRHEDTSSFASGLWLVCHSETLAELILKVPVPSHLTVSCQIMGGGFS